MSRPKDWTIVGTKREKPKRANSVSSSVFIDFNIHLAPSKLAYRSFFYAVLNICSMDLSSEIKNPKYRSDINE